MLYFGGGMNLCAHSPILNRQSNIWFNHPVARKRTNGTRRVSRIRSLKSASSGRLFDIVGVANARFALLDYVWIHGRDVCS